MAAEGVREKARWRWRRDGFTVGLNNGQILKFIDVMVSVQLKMEGLHG